MSLEVNPTKNQSFKFIGVPKKKQELIYNLLTYCKEIRDTAYPMKDSDVTKAKIVEFTAHKEKDIYSVTGSIELVDCDKVENRCFEAYITESDGENHIYLDILRLCVEDEPKIIRTSEKITEDDNIICAETIYSQLECREEKKFTSNFTKQLQEAEIAYEESIQLSAL